MFFRLQSSLAAVPLVPVGALAAASGRLVLAYASRRLRGRVSDERRGHLAAARDVLAGGRARPGLFALSPLPSAQLFVAAGLVAAPIVPVTAAFFAGRLVSYTLYVAAASLAEHSLGTIIRGSFTSPVGVGLQLVMLAALVALVRVDWPQVLARRSERASSPGTPSSSRHASAGIKQ